MQNEEKHASDRLSKIRLHYDEIAGAFYEARKLIGRFFWKTRGERVDTLAVD